MVTPVRMLDRLCACWLVLALVWTQTNSDETEQPQQPQQPPQPQQPLQPRNSSLPALSRSRRFLNLFSVIRCYKYFSVVQTAQQLRWSDKCPNFRRRIPNIVFRKSSLTPLHQVLQHALQLQTRPQRHLLHREAVRRSRKYFSHEKYFIS